MTEIIYQQENHRDFQGYSVKFLFLNSTNCFEFEKKEFRLNDSNTEVTVFENYQKKKSHFEQIILFCLGFLGDLKKCK